MPLNFNPETLLLEGRFHAEIGEVSVKSGVNQNDTPYETVRVPMTLSKDGQTIYYNLLLVLYDGGTPEEQNRTRMNWGMLERLCRACGDVDPRTPEDLSGKSCYLTFAPHQSKTTGRMYDRIVAYEKE